MTRGKIEKRGGRRRKIKPVILVHLPDYEKSNDACAQLIEHTSTAIKNAKKVEQYQIYNNANLPFSIGVNPFTDVYHLVESLI